MPTQENEGRNNSFASNRFTGREEQPTLEEILEGKDLTPEELRAAQAADLLSISVTDRQILFGAYVFIYDTTGIFRVKDLLGVSPDRAVGMRDRVRTDQRYEKYFEKLRTLLTPNYMEIAYLKRLRYTHRQIGELLGLSEYEVERISGFLVDSQIIEPANKGRAHHLDFERKLSDITPLRGKLNSADIAESTDNTLSSVQGAFKRLRKAGRLEALDRREVQERRPDYEPYLLIRAGVIRLRQDPDKRYTEQEITDILTTELKFVVTKQQVKRQIRQSIKDGKIKRRTNQIK